MAWQFKDADMASWFNPLFADAVMCVAEQFDKHTMCDITAVDLGRHLGIGCVEATALLDQFAEHGLLASPDARSSYTVLPEDGEELAARLAELGLVDTEQDGSEHEVEDASAEVGADGDTAGVDCAGASVGEQVDASPTDPPRVSREQKQTESSTVGCVDLVWKQTQPKHENLPLAKIVIDPEIQCRVKGLDKACVEDYAEAMTEGAVFERLVVFRGRDGVLRLADGLHRHAAMMTNGWTEADATVYEGDADQALLYAAGANGTHGLRRTQADVRNAITKLLSHADWVKRSNSWVAGVVGTTKDTVGSVRQKLEATGEIRKCDVRTTKDGREMNVGAIGHGRATADDVDAKPVMSDVGKDAAQVGDGERDAVITNKAQKAERRGVEDAAVVPDDDTAEPITDHQADSSRWIEDLAAVVARGMNAELMELTAGDAEAFLNALKVQITKLQALCDQLAEMSTAGQSAS